MKTRWTSHHLHLRYLERDDLPQIVSILEKESVCEHLFFGPNTEQVTLDYFTPFVETIEQSLKKGAQPLTQVLSVLHPETGELMGTCALLPIEFSTDNYLFGIQLDEPFWGQGFGTWAGRFLVQRAFSELGARRITGDCFASNAGSAAIMRGLGFAKEGSQRGHYMRKGEPVDNLLFGLLREDVDTDKVRSWRKAFFVG